MKTLKYFTIIGLVALIIPSCQKVIDVTVDDADENFVIDAFYDANAELVSVRITRTKALFSPDPNETIDNADITLTTPNGDVFNLVNLGNGIYELTNLAPEFDLSYKMTVLMEGEVFEATAFLPTPVPLDSLTQEFQPASLFGPEGYIIFMNLTDPGEITSTAQCELLMASHLPIWETSFCLTTVLLQAMCKQFLFRFTLSA